MIADSVAFLRGAGQARDLRRRALLRRLPRRPRLRAALPARGRRGRRRERHALRHQRRVAARRRSPRPPRAWWPSSASASQVGIHTHDDAGCGVANSLVAVERGAPQVQGTMNGYGERCGNANLVSILADAAAQAGLRLRRARAAGAPDRDRAPGRRDLQRDARTRTSRTSGANAFAHKGGMHVAGVNRDARTFEHIDPPRSATTGGC